MLITRSCAATPDIVLASSQFSRHVAARRAAVAVRLGDADAGSLAICSRWRGAISVDGAVLRQSLAQAGAGERRGAVSVFDDRLGGDLRLSSCSATCRRLPTHHRRRHHHRRRVLHLLARAGARAPARQSIRRRSCVVITAVVPTKRRDDRMVITGGMLKFGSPDTRPRTRVFRYRRALLQLFSDDHTPRTAGSSRPAGRAERRGSDAARRRSTGSRTSPARCATPDW